MGKKKKKSKGKQSWLMQSPFAQAWKLWNLRSLAAVMFDLLTYGAIIGSVAVAILLLNPLLARLESQTLQLQDIQSRLSTDPDQIGNVEGIDTIPREVKWTITGLIAAVIFPFLLLLLLFFTFQYLGWTFIRTLKRSWRAWLRFLLSQLYLFIAAGVIITFLAWILKPHYKLITGLFLVFFWLCAAAIFAASFLPERTAWQNFLRSNRFFWYNPLVLVYYLIGLAVGILLATVLYFPFTKSIQYLAISISIIYLLALMLWAKTFLALIVKKRAEKS